jgi:Chitobiase/beta-hexosaminidase C-terminal domain/Right handed beta helix region
VQKTTTNAWLRSSLGVITAVMFLAFTAACGSGGSSPSPPAAPTSSPAPTTVATPSISIPTGIYTSPQQVTLTDSSQGSSIYYTTDKSVPTSSSTLYQQPFSVSVSSTVQAIAMLDGSQSAVAASTLTINLPPTATMLAFVQQPTSAPVGSTISPAVQVAVEDSSGNPVTTATSPITLALVGGTGLSGTLTAVPTKGVAAFSNLSIATAGTGYTLVATSTGLGSATSASFSITPVAAKLAFSQQPSNALTGAAISPAITVTVEDANGKPVPNASNPVALTLVSGTGLGGTLAVTPSNGVTTFSNVTVSTAGTYMLLASSAGLTSATSAGFSVTAPIMNGTTIMNSMPIAITVSSGSSFEITYSWQAVPVTIEASVFVNFVDSTGKVQFQDDAQPPVATSQWSGPLIYTHTLTVPTTTAVGTYSIVAGLQSATGNISLVAGPGVTSLPDAQYQIGTVVLAPTCSITSSGAVGDGTTDNLAAIQNAFNYAAANHCIATVPAGTFAYSGNPNATGIAVAGAGAASILKPLSLTNQAIILSGSGGSISNLVMLSAATSRLLTQQSSMVYVNNASNYYIEDVLINNSSSTGIISQNSSGGYILNNTIENTLADSITQTYGSHGIMIFGNRILNSGDDGVSNNSYVGDPGPVNTITVQGNTVLNNKGGRGLEVSGGANITFAGNYVDNLDGYADMYIASETEFDTQGVINVMVSGNSFLDGGPNQGTAIVYNSQGAGITITSVNIEGNQFVNPGLSAIQYAGTGSETGVSVTNNIDYSNNAFSITSNTNASPTETGNQVLAPSSYTTPLVPSGGGCNFTGC